MKYHTKFAYPFLVALFFITGVAQSASLYLPLNMSPEIEARVERLFVLANMPIIKRPIPIQEVYRALDKLGDGDPNLSASIRSYLERYSPRISITHASLNATVSQGENQLLANQRGLESDSTYSASASGYLVATPWLLVNVGGQIHESEFKKDEFPEGTFISIGTDYLQVDIGNRPHWFGPFQDSDMLLSSNASATPGITLSNAAPLSLFGIRYELFLAQMSESDGILSQDRTKRLTGNPRLFGMHVSFEPAEGFAIGFNRLMQYGGADRDDSYSSLFKAFFNAKKTDNIDEEGVDFGNQLSSIATRYTFTGKFPVSVYMEYGGEDTSFSSNYHLGNTALMLGVHLPKLTSFLDFNYEYAEWQNGWYVNGNYRDGLRQYETGMGHWGANNRIFSDAVGATTQTAKLIWDIANGHSLTTRWRHIQNENYSNVDYKSGEEWMLEYAYGVGPFIVGATLTTGRTVFDEDYSMLSGFFRW